jgi:hypothetical protein
VKLRPGCTVHARNQADQSMRSRSFALLSSLVLGVVSHAQSAGLGIKGGPLASSVKAINLRTTPIAGATLGLYVPWGIGPRMELQPEILVSTMGARYTEPDADQFTVRSIYLQVPLCLKLYVGNGFNFSGGYQFGKPLAAQRTDDAGTTDVLDRYETLDMGFVVGAGIDFQNGLDLSLRGYSAMTPSLRNDDALFPKNKALQFTFGYRFTQFKSTRTGRRRG